MTLDSHKIRVLKYLYDKTNPVSIDKYTFPDSALYTWDFQGKGNTDIGMVILDLSAYNMVESEDNNKTLKITDKGVITIKPIIDSEILEKQLTEIQEYREMQERQIRQLDIMIKVDQVIDYPTVKRQRKNGYIFGAISLLVAIVMLIIALLKYQECK